MLVSPGGGGWLKIGITGVVFPNLMMFLLSLCERGYTRDISCPIREIIYSPYSKIIIMDVDVFLPL